VVLMEGGYCVAMHNSITLLLKINLWINFTSLASCCNLAFLLAWIWRCFSCIQLLVNTSVGRFGVTHMDIWQLVLICLKFYLYLYVVVLFRVECRHMEYTNILYGRV
jgi:hypothetical protein